MGINTLGGTSPSLVPTQTGNSGKILTTNGTYPSWINNTVVLIGSVSFTGSSVSFSNIPNTFRHLKIIGTIINGGNGNVSFNINGQNSAAGGWCYNNSAGTWTTSVSSTTAFITGYANTNGNAFELNLPNYTYNSNHFYSSISGSGNSSLPAFASGYVSNNGSAIDTININCAASSPVIIAALYGLL